MEIVPFNQHGDAQQNGSTTALLQAAQDSASAAIASAQAAKLAVQAALQLHHNPGAQPGANANLLNSSKPEAPHTIYLAFDTNIFTKGVKEYYTWRAKGAPQGYQKPIKLLVPRAILREVNGNELIFARVVRSISDDAVVQGKDQCLVPNLRGDPGILDCAVYFNKQPNIRVVLCTNDTELREACVAKGVTALSYHGWSTWWDRLASISQSLVPGDQPDSSQSGNKRAYVSDADQHIQISAAENGRRRTAAAHQPHKMKRKRVDDPNPEVQSPVKKKKKSGKQVEAVKVATQPSQHVSNTVGHALQGAGDAGDEELQVQIYAAALQAIILAWDNNNRGLSYDPNCWSAVDVHAAISAARFLVCKQDGIVGPIKDLPANFGGSKKRSTFYRHFGWQFQDVVGEMQKYGLLAHIPHRNCLKSCGWDQKINDDAVIDWFASKGYQWRGFGKAITANTHIIRKAGPIQPRIQPPAKSKQGQNPDDATRHWRKKMSTLGSEIAVAAVLHWEPSTEPFLEDIPCLAVLIAIVRCRSKGDRSYPIPLQHLPVRSLLTTNQYVASSCLEDGESLGGKAFKHYFGMSFKRATLKSCKKQLITCAKLELDGVMHSRVTAVDKNKVREWFASAGFPGDEQLLRNWS